MSRPRAVRAEVEEGETRGRVSSAEPQALDERGAPPTEPCLHCGHPVAVRLMGCKGGHCPNCRHPYPHGDCSD